MRGERSRSHGLLEELAFNLTYPFLLDGSGDFLPKIELDDANTTANLHCGKCDRTLTTPTPSERRSVAAGCKKLCQFLAQIYVRKGGGGRKEAGKEGGEGGEHHRGVGEQEQVSPACSRREGEGRGGEGLWKWKNIHSVRRRKGGKRLLTTARTSVQQIFLTGRQFFDVLLDQLIRYAKSDKT